MIKVKNEALQVIGLMKMGWVKKVYARLFVLVKLVSLAGVIILFAVTSAPKSIGPVKRKIV